MSDNSHWMGDVRSIEQLRDELRLKGALLRADLRDDLASLERRWAKVERDLEPVRNAVGTAARDVGASTKELLKTVRLGYERIRAAARTHA
jgi:hypothetical protein